MSVYKREASRGAEVRRDARWRADVAADGVREVGRYAVRSRMRDLSARLKIALSKAERLETAAQLDALWAQVQAWPS